MARKGAPAHRTRSTLSLRALGLLAAGALALASCSIPNNPAPAGPVPTSDAPTSGSPSGAENTQGASFQTLASNLNAPWSVADAGDALIVSERDSGRILEILDSGAVREVGRLPDVDFGGEGGLLGLAFKTPDRLYAYSTGPNGNRIQRFTLAGAVGSYSLSEPRTLLDGLPSASNHNGGRLAFGPDGMLYASVGDAARPASAQDLGSLGGKILRMDAEGGVPEDNPFPDSYVYSYGHRNVQGLAWDADGAMYASEFGQNTWDELNRITAGGNYGWPEVEGTGGTGEFTDPVAQWSTDQASPSGIAIVDSVLYLANLRGQRLRAVQLDDPEMQRELLVNELGRLRDVVPGPDGRLLVLTNNTDGRGDPGPQDARLISLPPSGAG